MPKSTPPLPPAAPAPTPEETKAERIAVKNKVLLLTGELIGSLELAILTLTTLMERAQNQLDRERENLRLFVREEAGLLTPEEQQRLHEQMREAIA